MYVVLCCTLLSASWEKDLPRVPTKKLHRLAHGEEKERLPDHCGKDRRSKNLGEALLCTTRNPQNTWDDSLRLEGPAVFIFVRRGSQQQRQNLDRIGYVIGSTIKIAK